LTIVVSPIFVGIKFRWLAGMFVDGDHCRSNLGYVYGV
jgi:hypothetical protein